MTKTLLGEVVSTVAPQCSFDRAAFVLAHMRCGSTALSNILCSRAEISGYGEAHIAYRNRSDLGRLVVNQALRRAWKPGARYVFDKVLHSRHDRDAPQDFFRSRAIFLCRRPERAIASIRGLFQSLGREEYTTDSLAADYYVERVGQLCRLWPLFPSERRLGLTHDALIGATDDCLARVTALLQLEPPLLNAYQGHAASVRGGGGDPLVSARRTKIEAPRREKAPEPLALDPGLVQRANEAYERYVEIIA
ncbi:sulfotransferase family protein [Mangrovicoccus sp. HB161399]|uniref:sulfotransferase family protein n=1 Tax=Mangrovicoccus sp. HB161399 TaxID=2720392 RepID=UPI001556248D|nr:sulfotransferase family protein [Mangrovicoccus sp. HB161399]